MKSGVQGIPSPWYVPSLDRRTGGLQRQVQSVSDEPSRPRMDDGVAESSVIEM